MKLIIDIHEEQYDFIKQGMPIDKVVQFPALMEAICEHIAQGIPLPKGHGRLIDADALIYRQTHHGNYCTPFELIDRNDLNNAPTIIEADKAESEGTK